MKVAEVCRTYGISEPTFYAWKAKFGGMSVPDARRLKLLEEENARLKKLLEEALCDAAETSLDLRNTGQANRRSSGLVEQAEALRTCRSWAMPQIERQFQSSYNSH